MFDSLGNRLQDVFRSIRSETRLTPETVEAALREIRLALLEADVNFKVVKAFVDRVRDRAMDAVAAGAGDAVTSRGPAPPPQALRIVRGEMGAPFCDAGGGPPQTNKRPPA